MVKNAIFTAFYGILQHFLVKFPTEFLVLSMDACIYMYIAPLNRRLCCGIFSYLPQLIVAKALDGQRYPKPLSICGCEVVRGAAAPKGPMTYAVLY